jgi:hypothetical protein
MAHGIRTHNLSYSRRHALPVELMLFVNYFFSTEVCILLLPISHMGVCKHHLRSSYILRYQSDGGSWFRDRAMTVIVELCTLARCTGLHSQLFSRRRYSRT